jgi:hypothetical protein
MTNHSIGFGNALIETLEEEIADLRAEIERLTLLMCSYAAEDERLRKELKWISTGGDLWSRQVALAALEPKP